MTMIVLDSSFFIAYHNSRDAYHQVASGLMQPLLAGEWGARLMPEYVFLEVTTVLALRRDHETAVRVGRILLNARELEFVPNSALFLDTFETFRKPSSEGLSFVDAAIVTIARQRGARHVLTFDSDFRGIDGLTVIPEP
jgi:predicted nucleic acid-binding protein